MIAAYRFPPGPRIEEFIDHEHLNCTCSPEEIVSAIACSLILFGLEMIYAAR